MIESFFSKMTRQMLRGIRVNTKQELEERIYKYFDEVNREPVVYHWKYKMDEIEKAHPDIFNILLQVMDYAVLTPYNIRIHMPPHMRIANVHDT